MTQVTTRKTKSELSSTRLIICALLGAAIGAGIGFVWATRDDEQRLPARAGGNAVRAQIRPSEVLRLGLSLVNVTRQVSELVGKV